MNWIPIVFGVFGGLALFLFGLQQLTDAMKAVAGKRLKQILEKMTSGPVRGVATGTVVTAALQSSSVTTVLIVGFISAGLMRLEQAIGVILGANLGSTFTAQLIAFNITEWSMALVAIGFLVWQLSKTDLYKNYGWMLLGLGMLFLGMEEMSKATEPLREYQPFIDLMSSMANPIIGIALGAIFTAIVQSSAATAGIVIVLASQGVVTLEAGIALILGANIGTCATALLATIGKNRESIQAAVFHIIFNILGALIWVLFIDELAMLARSFSPTFSNLEGAERMAKEVPRQVANAHTIFNLANILIFIWFTKPLASFVQFLVPIKESKSEKDNLPPVYINDSYLQSPDMAFILARKDILSMLKLERRMLKAIPKALSSKESTNIRVLKKLNKQVDHVAAHLVQFYKKMGSQNLTSEQIKQLHGLMELTQIVNNFDDVLYSAISSSWQTLREDQITPSPETLKGFNDLVQRTVHLHQKLAEGLDNEDGEALEEIMKSKQETRELIKEVSRRVNERLSSKDPKRIETYQLEIELAETMRRLNHGIRRMAKSGRKLIGMSES